MIGKKKHSVNMMFTVLLLGIFAMAAIFVAVMGARVYANSAEKMHANFDTRTSLVYLSEKIRTSQSDHFSVKNLDDGTTALVLQEQVGETIYESWIFVANERLCEITVAQGDKVLPGIAQQIMDLKSFEATIHDHGVEIVVETLSGDLDFTYIHGRTNL